MRKIITVSLLTLSLNATAGWGGNNGPWGNNGWSNGPWGGSNNGVIGNNPYSMFTPDWFSEEMSDMMDEFDSNNSGPWGNNSWNNNGPWGKRGFNNGPWGNNGPWNNSNFGNTPWGNHNGPWNNNSWRNSPWSNYGYNRAIPAAADTGTTNSK